VHVASRPLDGERQSGDPPAVSVPFELVVVAAADRPHGAARGVGEQVCAPHVGRAGCLIAVDADHVTGDQVVDGVEVGFPFEKCSAGWADGSAMLTTVVSNTTITCATPITARISQRREYAGSAAVIRYFLGPCAQAT
jgi:hypothetical protein